MPDIAIQVAMDGQVHIHINNHVHNHVHNHNHHAALTLEVLKQLLESNQHLLRVAVDQVLEDRRATESKSENGSKEYTGVNVASNAELKAPAEVKLSAPEATAENKVNSDSAKDSEANIPDNPQPTVKSMTEARGHDDVEEKKPVPENYDLCPRMGRLSIDGSRVSEPGTDLPPQGSNKKIAKWLKANGIISCSETTFGKPSPDLSDEVLEKARYYAAAAQFTPSKWAEIGAKMVRSLVSPIKDTEAASCLIPTTVGIEHMEGVDLSVGTCEDQSSFSTSNENDQIEDVQSPATSRTEQSGSEYGFEDAMNAEVEKTEDWHKGNEPEADARPLQAAQGSGSTDIEPSTNMDLSDTEDEPQLQSHEAEMDDAPESKLGVVSTASLVPPTIPPQPARSDQRTFFTNLHKKISDRTPTLSNPQAPPPMPVKATRTQTSPQPKLESHDKIMELIRLNNARCKDSNNHPVFIIPDDHVSGTQTYIGAVFMFAKSRCGNDVPKTIKVLEAHLNSLSTWDWQRLAYYALADIHQVCHLGLIDFPQHKGLGQTHIRKDCLENIFKAIVETQLTLIYYGYLGREQMRDWDQLLLSARDREARAFKSAIDAETGKWNKNAYIARRDGAIKFSKEQDKLKMMKTFEKLVGTERLDSMSDQVIPKRGVEDIGDVNVKKKSKRSYAEDGSASRES